MIIYRPSCQSIPFFFLLNMLRYWLQALQMINVYRNLLISMLQYLFLPAKIQGWNVFWHCHDIYNWSYDGDHEALQVGTSHGFGLVLMEHKWWVIIRLCRLEPATVLDKTSLVLMEHKPITYSFSGVCILLRFASLSVSFIFLLHPEQHMLMKGFKNLKECKGEGLKTYWKYN